MAAAAAEAGAALVVPSTDYVFDGRAGRAVRRGRRARAARRLRAHEARPASARRWRPTRRGRGSRARRGSTARPGGTSWTRCAALGAERDEVAVVDDQEGSPPGPATSAPALEALLDQPPGVYHTAGGGSVTWAGFARGGLRGGRHRTAGWCRSPPPARPSRAPARALSPLAVTRPGAPRLRPWRDALRDYITETA